MKGKTKLIHDIAKEMGVSLATAYRAVTSPNSVAAETRLRVLKLMEERNISIARRPRSVRRPRVESRIGRVAFLVPQMPFRTVEMISEEMSHGIQKVFTERGIELTLHPYVWDGDPSAVAATVPKKESLDGLLIRPPSNRALLEAICHGRKAVLLGNGFPDLSIPSVLIDDDRGIGSVMDYLFELGHRRIAYVSLGPKMSIYRRRLDAYVSYLYRRGIPLEQSLVKLHDGWVTPTDEAAQLYQRFARELLALRVPPTAIVCTSDSFAAGVMAAVREQGIRVPEQISITGYGDQYFAALADPPLTTVHVDQRAIGEMGARLLLSMLDGMSAASQVLIPPTLIERRSCAAVSK